ncbi:hypothetical protein, partial [Sneathiella sp.]|uniref:hypothetical protein n=1 Tax=Sneathiella sp. TaxID=1964365 RepID=UPI002632C0F9
MLAYFIIGVSLLLALMVGSQAIATADPKKLIKALRISAVIICAVVAGFFALTGRFPYAAPFVAAGLFFLRSKPLFSARNPSSGQQSDVETDWLQASLNHDTGEMDAMILQGRFEGRKLSSLSRAELGEFHQECAGDEQTLAILEGLKTRFPALR